MKKFFKIISIFLTFIFLASCSDNNETKKLAESYANLVSNYYEETAKRTNSMFLAINDFLNDPNEFSLENAKNKWISAREVYGITEAFRFYGGPIDGTNQYGEEGPEGLINSWPLNEAYIDYVEGNPEAGIVNNLLYKINKDTIMASNQSDDDADVSTGWHAIEFLLWGQDSSIETAGQREFTDYVPINEINNRRRDYLLLVTELLVEHINWLNDQWKPNGAGRDAFLSKESPGSSILTGIATLSGFELSSERIATALDSGDPEDEHSCFSDQTHLDIRANFNGIKNIYLGLGINNQKFSPSVSEIIANKNPKLNEKIIKTLDSTSNNINYITVPFDKMLSETKNSPGRVAAEKTVSDLIILAENFIEAGKELNWDVIIAE
tara:strand:- start:1860 stop:3002 length:1143 start_codon:yes stop_codon:yes gene_type:complete